MEDDHPGFPETVNFTVQRLARVECVLFTFHQLGRRCPQFLASPETLKSLRVRSVSYNESILSKRLTIT